MPFAAKRPSSGDQDTYSAFATQRKPADHRSNSDTSRLKKDSSESVRDFARLMENASSESSQPSSISREQSSPVLALTDFPAPKVKSKESSAAPENKQTNNEANNTIPLFWQSAFSVIAVDPQQPANLSLNGNQIDGVTAEGQASVVVSRTANPNAPLPFASFEQGDSSSARNRPNTSELNIRLTNLSANSQAKTSDQPKIEAPGRNVPLTSTETKAPVPLPDAIEATLSETGSRKGSTGATAGRPENGDSQDSKPIGGDLSKESLPDTQISRKPVSFSSSFEQKKETSSTAADRIPVSKAAIQELSPITAHSTISNGTPLLRTPSHQTSTESQVATSLSRTVATDTNRPASAMANEVTFRVQGQQGETVNIKVMDRAGEIYIAVRSSDQQTASVLHRDLSSLSSNLESLGWKLEFDTSGQHGNRSDSSRQQYEQSNSRKDQNASSPDWKDPSNSREKKEDPWLDMIDQQFFS